MNRDFKEIYSELLAGQLSQQAALERIKTLKRAERDDSGAWLFAVPVWESDPGSGSMRSGAAEHAQRCILLCDLPRIAAREIEALLPQSQCMIVDTGHQPNVADAYTHMALACFEAIQALLKAKPQRTVLVQVVIAARSDAQLFAGLSGLLKTATLENPNVTGQIVFAQPDVTADELARQLQAEQSTPLDSLVQYTKGTRRVRRWRTLDANREGSTRPHDQGPFKERGVYLITGGLGGLGVLIAKEIRQSNPRARVILTGRAALNEAKAAVLESLRSADGSVDYRQVDVSNLQQVRQLIADIVKEHGQLNGIVHGAGVLSDAFILKKTPAQFSRVLLPKVTGTFNLDLATEAVELDFLLLFSSIASWVGNLGQADYAAANGFMDQFADYRNRLVAEGKRRGRTLTIGWQHWLEGGMNVDAASMASLRQKTGLSSLDTRTGMQALYRSLALEHSHVMVLKGDPALVHRALVADRMIQPEQRIQPKHTASASPAARESAPAQSGGLAEKTREFLRNECAAVLKIPAHKVDIRAPLESYGIDSIVAMSLTHRLEATFGTLAKTLFFEYLTIDDLAGYFVQAHAEKLVSMFSPPAAEPQSAAEPESTAPRVAASSRSRSVSLRRLNRRRSSADAAAIQEPVPSRAAAEQTLDDEPIAIIGLSGRYPQARDVDAFWRNLRDGKDCIVEIPPERWDWREYYSEDRSQEGAHFSKWGGFIEGVDEFDPRFFNIAPREAHTIDPQERLFLQHAWMAIEDAGFTRAGLQIPHKNQLPAQVGVYAGVMYGEYNLSGTLASIANRVSYFLNLHGPSLTLDTMCSSSLTAIHLACQDLKLGRTSLAIAGGVNVSIHPNKYRLLSSGQFISSDGCCQSFGEGGDGYIPGEGVGVAILKRLHEAERDGNHIYGVIRGSALNHGGKTNGYTVPNPVAQADVIRQALTAANVDPRHVSYIEAHGTGTKLGDPIEIAALTRAFNAASQVPPAQSGYCRIGSAKSNIGHCESAAGIAGVTKVLLQMKHRSIVPSLHSRKLNPHIDFKATPFVVNQELTPWEQPEVDGRRLPRIAGVSSFGAGGANAHVILEEYRAPQAAGRTDATPVVVPLSARTTEQLQQKARDLLAFIKQQARAVDLTSMAYTLQVGREAMEERVCFVASSIELLASKLETFLTGGTTEDVYRGQVKQHKETLSQLTADPEFQKTVDRRIADKQLAALSEHWVKGLEIDWRKLIEEGSRPQLMSLPIYPFARERYWTEPLAGMVAVNAQATTLHPLVHTNTSDLTQQSYSSTFTGAESFLAQDARTGQKTLPPLLTVELMRAAVDLATRNRVESGFWEMRSTAWGEPILAAGNRPVRIALLAREIDEIDLEVYSDSGDGADERVHCQSRAIFSREPAPARLDVEPLKRSMSRQQAVFDPCVADLYHSEQQLLARIQRAARPSQDKLDSSLQSDVLEIVAELVSRLTGPAGVPVSLECARIVLTCPENLWIWARHSSSMAIDIDVVDEKGNLCLQLQGLHHEYQPAQVAIAPELRESVPTAAPLGKPTEITLAPKGELTLSALIAKPTIALSNPTCSAPQGTLSPMFRVCERGDGVFAIEADAIGADGAFHSAQRSGEVIEYLLQALDRVRQEASAKVLLLEIGDVWPGDRQACNRAIERRLFSAFAGFEYPVVAFMPADASGAGLLLGAVCDFMVCSQEGRYGFTDFQHGLFPSDSELRFFRERLGDVLANDLLFQSTRLTGLQLKQKGWACRIVPGAQVRAAAAELAADLASKSHLALRLLKAHLGRHLLPLIEDFTTVGAGALESFRPSDEVTRAAIASQGKYVHLEMPVDGVLAVRLSAAEPACLADLVTELKDVFAQVEHASSYRCVILTSDRPSFLPEAATAADVEAIAQLKQLVQRCEVPVISAFTANATGLSWLLGLSCDACVYQTHGQYSTTGLWRHHSLASEAAALFESRLGSSLGREVCLTEDSYSGLELQARVGALIAVDPSAVMSHALQLAAFWRQWPREILVAWKKAQATHLQSVLRSRPVWQQGEGNNVSSPIAASEPNAISLRSNVVKASAYPEGVVVVSLEDRQAKNMFSAELVNGLKEVFAHIERTPAYKAVVLTGYDSYFATGGTRETLLAIQQGQAQFTDEKIFEVAMECSLPVIAAMQGHGIGGGWSFGMFADVAWLSEESHYSSPYMGYGFTPGAGATLVFPHKIGYDLARETLLTAREMSGRDLQERGLPLPVSPRKEIVSNAIALARRVARHPREHLQNLKRQWTHSLRQLRDETYRRELAMHEQTFVRSADTLQNIQARFGSANIDADAPAGQADSPRSVSPAPAEDAVLAEIKALLAKELHLHADEIDETTPFIDLGLDSITGVTWMRRINERYGTNIEATKVYTHPTLREIGRYVTQEAEKTGALASSIPTAPAQLNTQRPEPAQTNTPRTEAVQTNPLRTALAEQIIATRTQIAPRPRAALVSWRAREQSTLRLVPQAQTQSAASASFQPIAIVGMAGQFPKASDVNEFWANIAAGRDCISEVSDGRWSPADYYEAGAPVPGKTNGKWFGALQEYDRFDPLFFNISPTEAQCMDPQQRVFLQACWHSIENAGYNPQSLSGGQCGVFVGCGAGDYHQLSRAQQLSAQGFTGAATSILAARISYFLNLRGPCISIDTACSSALVAIASACDSLNSGSSDVALAGGVYVMSGPAMHIMTSQAGMLSTDGRCYTFDQRANGFVPGEGVGVVMLKRLADAERDQDRILAVIEGWGVNQDGKTNGITAPNEASQTRLLQGVYEKFKIDPAGIQLIEAHGTGTKLGDPIEVAGLKGAFQTFTSRQDYCALGSVKSNIGHCLTAAGAAGLIKLVLALRHQQLPPTINFQQCNEHIRLQGSPFFINDRLQAWKVSSNERRRAAVSSFGFSGTNAHIAVAEYVAASQARPRVSVIAGNNKAMVPLSARTQAQLDQKARDLLVFLRRQNESLDLMDLAYTLQIGREEMSERAGFLVASVADLIAKLEAYVAGEQNIVDVYKGRVKRNPEELQLLSQDDEMRDAFVAKWLRQQKLSKLLNVWAKGLDFDWNRLYGETKPRRIELPGYPFAKERFWIGAGSTEDAGSSRSDILHPLLHRNVSLLSQQRYRADFNGEEFFVDAAIGGVKVLPPLSLLEMARAAVRHATADLEQPAAIELRDIAWLQPCFVAGNETGIAIALSVNPDESIDFEICHAGTEGEGSGEAVVKGVAILREPIQATPLDVASIQARLFDEQLDPAALYAAFERTGAKFGKALQGLTAINRGSDQLLATISLPGVLDHYQRDYVLHPSLMEGAVQACVAFVRDPHEHADEPLLPLSMDSLTVAGDCEKQMLAWVRYAEPDGAVADQRKLDVDLLDEEGQGRVLIRGLVLGNLGGDLSAPVTVSADPAEMVLMTPRWDVVESLDGAAIPEAGKKILVIGADDRHRSVLGCHYPASTIAFVSIAPQDDSSAIALKLQGVELDKLVFIASAHDAGTLTEQTIVEDQSRGILQLLRLIRALTQLGYEKQAIEWDLITFVSLPIKQTDTVNPTHASLHGFAGSMAEVYPRWNIRLLDVQELSDTTLTHLRKLPRKANGVAYGLRHGEWFEQKLVSVRKLADGNPPYRSQAVYVVIGGSGGIGEIWTRHVIEHYQANVIWIGRRELDDEIRQKIDSISALGKAPEYIQADASNLYELEAAYRRIKTRYPQIHGVVHSAVGAFDQSLKTVSEEDFRTILSAKIDLSVRIAQVFHPEALDFVLFFSSNASFVRGAGMSGYSSGSTFKDAFALQLGKLWSCKVKVINWGYWSVGAGAALTDAMKEFFQQTGYLPLEPHEAMKALDVFLPGPLNQISIVRRLRPAEGQPAQSAEWLATHGDRRGGASDRWDLSALENLRLPAAFQSITGKVGGEMEPLLTRLLRAILSSTTGTLSAYDRWLLESRKIVGADADSADTLERLWIEWDEAQREWLQDPGKSALCALVDRCVRALPDILTGKQKPTEVIFPNSSLDWVERVYKTDAISLAFNDCLCDALIAAIQARLRAQPDIKIRLLEIGAGTGATTVRILDKLKAYETNIAEYCYTDVSKAFLFHADNSYAPLAPYLRTQLFNVEQPIAKQGVNAGCYDFVIAANVLHATRNIRNTLRNAKAVLRDRGILLMNEVSDRSICGHVTFGLLDGWWLNDDAAIRIPGSPGIYPDTWQRILQEEGFFSVLYPARQAHSVGQQIIVAVSDGVVRQKAAAASSQVGSPSNTSQSAKAVASNHGKAPSSPVPAPRHDSGGAIGTDALLRDKTVQLCRQLIGKALKMDSHQIDPGEPLERYGIDSIIVALVNRQLQQYFADIGSTLLYEYQTVDALAGHLVATQRARLERLFELDQTAQTSAAPAEAKRAAATNTDMRSGARVSPVVRGRGKAQAIRSSHAGRQAIAIVGISGVYPQAPTLVELWENLQAGKNCVTEIPPKRWSLDGFYEPDEQKAVEQGKSYCKWGGFVDQFAEFDTLFFGIPPREALNMDPQERLFLQVAWSALENAGYTRNVLREKFKRRVGVFAGITRAGYNLYRPTFEGNDKFWPRTSFGSVANRLSYFLDVQGPSLPVDTMCSSSLTAIHEACEHIHNGDCDLAIAGGVNLYLHPTSYIDMSSQHMLSKDGACRSFGEGANGFVPGEGAGVVLLKRLDRAIEDQDIIHGLILATHVNHGGKTSGFTVPNPVAQAQLVRSAIDKAGISAREISYIEAHGTGTELGDPIEITGLQQAFAKDSTETGYCKLGSAKSNFGHLEAAAGIAGLTKVLLQMRHGQIVPSLHAAKLNPHLKLDGTPFEVSQTLSSWERPVVDGKPKPRIAGISSFGAGGANAHVIVQEYVGTPTRARGKDHPVAVPLSARTPEQLRQKATELLDFLQFRCDDIDLEVLAYTLQVGREAMEHRVGFVVQSLEQLQRKLSAYINSEESIEDVYRGHVQRNNDGLSIFVQDDDMSEALGRWIARGKLARLLELWVKGLDLDWSRLYDASPPRRIELPTYPFARDEYWIDSLAARRPANRDANVDRAAAPDFRELEDIIDRIDADAIETSQGVRLLKQLM